MCLKMINLSMWLWSVNAALKKNSSLLLKHNSREERSFILNLTKSYSLYHCEYIK